MRSNVNQNSPTVQRAGTTDLVSKTRFNLSHDYKTTFSMGWLVPFLTEECLPGDEWSVKSEVMLRFAPLYLPIMHRVNLHIEYYYVPNRILWPEVTFNGVDTITGWSKFLLNNTGNNAGIHPRVTIAMYGLDGYAYGYLGDYFGLPSELGTPAGTDPTYDWNLTINALPFSAYMKIWDEYYRNPQVTPKSWVNCVDGSNDVLIGGYNGFTIKRRPWNLDLFTSAYPMPLAQSDQILIPMVRRNNNIDPFNDSWDNPFDFQKPYLPTTWYQTNGTAAPAGNLAYDPTQSRTEITGLGVGLDIQTNAASIQELRFAMVRLEYLERLNRAGGNEATYNSYLAAFWHTYPMAGIIDRPVLFGSEYGRVIVSEVLATAETVSAEQQVLKPLGAYAGQALALEAGKRPHRITTEEHGWIFGIISVVPQSSYANAFEMHKWLKNDVLDYPMEQFAFIGDEEIRKGQVQYSYKVANIAANYEAWGYTNRYHFWRYVNDKYTGYMRTQYESFHMGRIFTDDEYATNELNDNFVYCIPDIQRVFRVAEGEHEIFAHIYNDVSVNRRLPKYGLGGV